MTEKDAIVLDLIIERILESELPICSEDLKKELLIIEKDESEHENELERLSVYLKAVANFTYSNVSLNSVEKKDSTTKRFFENGGFKKLHQDELDRIERELNNDKLKTENLKLQNENLEYSKTIREQESRIRDLEEKTKIFELLKSYWWFIGICIGFGMFLLKLLDIIMT